MSGAQRPSAWRVVKFGDVARQVKDRVDPDTAGLDRYVAGEHMDTDDLRIRRWGVIGEGYLGPAFHMRFKPGHVLYGSRRTYLRKVAVADFEGICANTTFVLETATPELLPEFLPLVMTTEAFHAHSIEQSKGSVSPYINFRDLTWFEFALPTVDEQRAMCARVVEANRVPWAYEVVEERLAVLRSALAAEAWTATDVTTTLGQVAAVTVGIVVRPAALYVDAEGVPALRSLNIFPNRIEEADSVRISDAGHAQHAKSALRGGEVVVVRSGRPGDAAVIPDDGVARNAIDLLIVRCGPELDPYFLASLLNSATGRSQMLGRSAGTAQQHLNASQLQQVEIPRLPLGSQQDFSERFRSVDALERQLHQASIASQSLVTRELHRLMTPESAHVQ